MFKSYNISRMLSGGETMKTLVLALALVCMLSAGCLAATATIDLYADSALLALPQVPLDPNPDTVFASSGIDPWYNIARWDSIGGGYTYLDDTGAFGNMLLGDGFWCAGTQGQHIQYDAVLDGVPDSNGNKTDMWISLPGQGNGNGGSAIIGNPFAHSIDVDKGTYTGDNIFFTDGTTMLTWGEACQDPYNWVSQTLTYWTGFGYDMVWFDNTSGPYQLDPGMGYWIGTYKDNLAMIIPAD